ncbi:MAG TPA: NTP transferase domain-containing protein [Fimbriimonadaceae bacterium]|nr:NTP transferase domain-containing protein [Fimbriimonadaceae bacterium]HRJ96524.1 NTP transferase domain-containing protein [Fimbriimonadaceae bacterium]
MKWGVVIAAGGTVEPELRQAIGSHRKALARLGPRTSLAWTLDAVAEAGLGPCVTVTGSDVADEIAHGEFVAEGRSAIDNARLGLEALPKSVEAVLFIPADTPLMDGPMLREFAEGIDRRVEVDNWCAAGLTPAGRFREAFPEATYKALRLREGPHLSGALYAASPIGLRTALDLAGSMRRSRKSQLAMAKKLGILNMLRYFSGRVSVERAEAIVGRLLGIQTIIVPDCHPATCLDFDTVEDWQHVLRAFESRDSAGDFG